MHLTTLGSTITCIVFFAIGFAVGWWATPTKTLPGEIVKVEVPVIVPSPIGIGNKVKITASNLRVRDKDIGKKVICMQPNGAAGVVIEGSLYRNENIWWKVKFDNGCSGWVTQSYLKFQ